MLSIEIRVNGNPVAVLTAHNRSFDGAKGEYEGQYVHFQIGGEPAVGTFVCIEHMRADGIMVLARKLLQAIEK